jgi:hypothetical protein
VVKPPWYAVCIGFIIIEQKAVRAHETFTNTPGSSSTGSSGSCATAENSPEKKQNLIPQFP